MAFIRIRTLKGKNYRYLQWSYREGKKVKTGSLYLGTFEHGGSHLVRMMEGSKQREVEQPALPQGLRVGPDNPTPQEKAPSKDEGASHAGAGNQSGVTEGAAPDGDHE
jgi:hypothetical protein